MLNNRDYLEATLVSLSSSIRATLWLLILLCDCFTVVPALLPPSRNVTVVVVSVPLLLPSDSRMIVSLNKGKIINNSIIFLIKILHNIQAVLEKQWAGSYRGSIDPVTEKVTERSHAKPE